MRRRRGIFGLALSAAASMSVIALSLFQIEFFKHVRNRGSRGLTQRRLLHRPKRTHCWKHPILCHGNWQLRCHHGNPLATWVHRTVLSNILCF